MPEGVSDRRPKVSQRAGRMVRERESVPISCRTRPTMRTPLSLVIIPAISVIGSTCVDSTDDTQRTSSSTFSATVTPIATISFIGADTLSDSARIYRLEPEPDGGSIAFLFADPVKGITAGLGILQVSGNQAAQIGWPDSVLAVWWSKPHQLSFTAGTGQGIRVVVDAHAAELQTVEAARAQDSATAARAPARSEAYTRALSRTQAFIDSVRVQPAGTPQRSALRYRADSTLMARGDTLAAVHVSAQDSQRTQLNPAWYLVHLPSGHVQAVDSLTGQSVGLEASAGQWGADGSFYYAKERSIWRARPTAK